MATLFLRRCGNRYDRKFAGIQSIGYAPDGTALAGRVVAFKDRDERQVPKSLGAKDPIQPALVAQ